MTERLRAGGELVEQDTQREKIAAGIAPVVLQLFRRNVGCRARGELFFLGEQIGIACVLRKAKIEQHGLARRT